MAATPPPQPTSQSGYPQAPVGSPPPRKTSPWVWVAVGCGGLILVVLLAIAVGGFLLARKAKDFVAEAEKNPALAAVRLAVSVNPELEIVESDDEAGIITVRNTRTGEEFTVDLEEVEDGTIRFRNDKGEEVSLSATKDGKTGRFRVESDDGELTIGGGDDSNVPDWVPRYPGAEVTGAMTSRGDKGVEGGFSFSTEDSVADVLEFYEAELRDLGLEVSSNTYQSDGVTQGGVVGGESDDRSRTCSATATRTGDSTTVAVVYKDKSR